MKNFLIILASVIYCSMSFAQDVPYGYRSSNGLPSTTILIQPGFLLDSIVCVAGQRQSQTLRLEYDEQHRLKRDSNFNTMTASISVIIPHHPSPVNELVYEPILNDYYYNTNGKIDSSRCSYYSIPDSTWKSYSGIKNYYSNDGKLISHIYLNGNGSENFFYDSIGNLILTKVYEVGSDGSGGRFIADTVINSYSYDSLGRLVMNKSATLDGLSWGYSTYYYLSVYRYNTSGNVTLISEEIPLTKSYSSFDTLTQMAGDTMLVNNPPTYCFDTSGRMIKKISSSYSSGSLVPLDSIYYNYDGNGNMLGDGDFWFAYDSYKNLTTLSIVHSTYFPGVSLVDSYGNRINWDYSSGMWVFYYHSTVTGGCVSNPAIQINTKTISFNNVKVGTFKDATITITNTGNDTLKITNIASSRLTFMARPIVINIPPGQSLSDTLRFAPATTGTDSALVVIQSNAGSSPDTIKVSGFGFGIPTLQFNTKIISFGNVNVGTFKDTSVTITNSGNDTLKIANIVTSRSTFTARPTVKIIPPGQLFTDTLRFTPITAGADSALFVIKSNSGGSPDTMKVAGIAIPTTGIENTGGIPKEYSLSQNYPNPFNPSTTIQYGLPARSSVRFVIYNVLGQVVKELINTEQQAGYQTAVWNANVASGMYFYRIVATSLDGSNKNFVETKKMLLLK